MLAATKRQTPPTAKGTNAIKRSVKGTPEEGMIVASRNTPMNDTAVNKPNQIARRLLPRPLTSVPWAPHESLDMDGGLQTGIISLRSCRLLACRGQSRYSD